MEQEGIKVYNSQTSYEKWEFVYDMSKDKTRTGGIGVPQQIPQQVSPSLVPIRSANRTLRPLRLPLHRPYRVIRVLLVPVISSFRVK